MQPANYTSTSSTQGYIFTFLHSYVMTGLACAFLSQEEKIQILDNPLTNNKGWENYLTAQKFCFSHLEYVSYTQRFNRTSEYWQW